MILAIASLSLLVIIQNVFYMSIVKDLTGKLMSRSYYEFEQAKTLKEEVKKTKPRVPEEQGPSDDLGVLNDFQVF